MSARKPSTPEHHRAKRRIDLFAKDNIEQVLDDKTMEIEKSQTPYLMTDNNILGLKKQLRLVNDSPLTPLMNLGAYSNMKPEGGKN